MEKRFVIRYADGLYDQEHGNPVRFYDATTFTSESDALDAAQSLSDDPVVVDYDEERQRHRFPDELKAFAERDAYREALRVIARDIADDGSVTQQQVDAAYALARECAGVGK